MSSTPYELTARCLDLPELVDQADGELVLALPSGELERVVAAVAARRDPGALLQEKVDGCWCALAIGTGGIVESATSRSGLALRAADGWIGQRVHSFLADWTLIGEAECGTQWSAAHRDDNPIPRLHLYAAIDARGRRVSTDRVRALTLRHLHVRIAYVNECGAREDWAEFARRVLEAGGEGVVIRAVDGTCYRAKPRSTVDRVVARAYSKADHTGAPRRFADLAVTEAGRLRTVQSVLVPEAIERELRRGRVVAVAGASVSPAGVVRHARIVELRPRDEKQPAECTL